MRSRERRIQIFVNGDDEVGTGLERGNYWEDGLDGFVFGEGEGSGDVSSDGGEFRNDGFSNDS